jgi:hypothetical protein
LGGTLPFGLLVGISGGMYGISGMSGIGGMYGLLVGISMLFGGAAMVAMTLHARLFAY